jgi:hypothetical protein
MTDDQSRPLVRMFTMAEQALVVGSTGTANLALGTQIWSGRELPPQPPKEHPIYNHIGRISAAWSHVDHLLDILIWQLADVDAQAGACITAQISGTFGRFRAVIALLQYHQQRTNKPLATLIKRATELSGKSNGPAEGRHRAIHDPWYQYKVPASDTAPAAPAIDTAQFRSMPHKDPRYGIAPVDEAALEKNLADIRDFTAEVEEFRKQVLDALVTDTKT